MKVVAKVAKVRTHAGVLPPRAIDGRVAAGIEDDAHVGIRVQGGHGSAWVVAHKVRKVLLDRGHLDAELPFVDERLVSAGTVLPKEIDAFVLMCLLEVLARR